MGFSVDLSEVDVEKLDTGGRPLPGKCQLLVTAVEEKDGYISVEHEIVAHEKKTEVGKTSFNSFGLDGKSAKRTLRFLIATGQTTKEDAAASGGALGGSGDDLIGKVYFGKLEESTWNDKTKVRAEWDIWGPLDERCLGYPFDDKVTPKESPARKKAPPAAGAANAKDTKPKSGGPTKKAQTEKAAETNESALSEEIPF